VESVRNTGMHALQVALHYQVESRIGMKQTQKMCKVIHGINQRDASQLLTDFNWDAVTI